METKMKRIAALAALAACQMGAHAQSSVTLYGLVDAAVTYGDPGGGASSVKRLDSGVAGGPRLGFRGVEDLGSGLRANFQIEMGFGIDTGTPQQGGVTWGRQAFVGLGGANWTLTAGRQYSPNEVSITAAEAFAQTYWGSSAGFGIGTLQSPGSGTVLGAGCQGATVRINNSVQGTYTAGPVTAKLMVGAGDENERGSGRMVNPGVTYAAGPLMLTAGYTRIRQCALDIAADASPDWQTEVVLGGTYDFGAAKLFTGYYNWNPSEANKTVTTTTYTNHKVVWLGARVPVGQGNVITQVARLKQTFDGQADATGTLIGLTYEHYLSKRTRVYVSSARLSNNERSRFGITAATAAQPVTGLGADPKVLSLGTVHTF
jgi:predicted porin